MSWFVILQTLNDVLHGVTSAVPGALSVSSVSMVILIGGKILNERFKNKLPVAVPWELILVRLLPHTCIQTHRLSTPMPYVFLFVFILGRPLRIQTVTQGKCRLISSLFLQICSKLAVIVQLLYW